MDYSFRFDIGDRVRWRSLKGTVTGLMVKKDTSRMVLFEWWPQKRGRQWFGCDPSGPKEMPECQEQWMPETSLRPW